MSNQDAYNIVFSMFLYLLPFALAVGIVTPSFDGKQKPAKQLPAPKKKRVVAKREKREKREKRKKPPKLSQHENDLLDRYRIGRDYGNLNAQRMPL